MCSRITTQCPQGTTSSIPDVMKVLPMCEPCGEEGSAKPRQSKEIPIKLNFVVQWYVEKLEQEKRFFLSYYDYDGTIELKDLDRQKSFLRRMKVDTVKLCDLFLGNKLLVLARQMVILDYGDSSTKNYCLDKCERAFLLVRPEAMDDLPCIIQRIEKCLRILRGKIITLSQQLAYSYSSEFSGKENFLEAVGSLEGRNAAVFLLMGENALQKIKYLVGEQQDPKDPYMMYKQTLRASFGQNEIRNGFFYTETTESTLQHAGSFFSQCSTCVLPTFSVINGETTCCVIKPHIMKAGRTGHVLSDIVANGFNIVTLGVFWLNRRQAEEFYEIYKRIFAEAGFMAMVDELAVGPCMAVELTSKNQNTVEEFRNICGPSDSIFALQIRPQTIRALHGFNRIQNAVHCTELPEDNISELEYFFKILDRECNGVRDVTGIVPGSSLSSITPSCSC